MLCLNNNNDFGTMTSTEMLHHMQSLCVSVVLIILLNVGYGSALSPVALDYNAESFGMLRKTPYPHFMMFHAPWYDFFFLNFFFKS